MSDRPRPPLQQLEYAQDVERRVPMYAIVLSILAAAFLIFMGALATVGCVAFVWESFEHRKGEASIALLVLAPFAIIFLLAGIAQLAGTIRQLRGTTARATTTERAFRILNTDFSGRTYEDRYR
jgi:hypothetical protein